MPQVQVLENFNKILDREYWITADGKKLYPHQFEDEHLANTLGFIHRQASIQRIDTALRLCTMIHRGIGYNGRDTMDYYRAYKRETDKFLDPDMTDIEWLKQNSKIYVLLLEEAKFRGVEPNENPPRKVRKNMVKSRFNFANNKIFNW